MDLFSKVLKIAVTLAPRLLELQSETGSEVVTPLYLNSSGEVIATGPLVLSAYGGVFPVNTSNPHMRFIGYVHTHPLNKWTPSTVDLGDVATKASFLGYPLYVCTVARSPRGYEVLVIEISPSCSDVVVEYLRKLQELEIQVLDALRRQDEGRYRRLLELEYVLLKQLSKFGVRGCRYVRKDTTKPLT